MPMQNKKQITIITHEVTDTKEELTVELNDVSPDEAVFMMISGAIGFSLNAQVSKEKFIELVEALYGEFFEDTPEE